MGLAGVLAHDGGGNWIVTANSDAENETKSDKPPDVGREGARDCACGENQDFDAVDPLAADHVRDSTKEERTNSCSE